MRLTSRFGATRQERCSSNSLVSRINNPQCLINRPLAHFPQQIKPLFFLEFLVSAILEVLPNLDQALLNLILHVYLQGIDESFIKRDLAFFPEHLYSRDGALLVR